MRKRQWTAFCTKSATYMAKTEFNTCIETLTIFLVSVVAAVRERALFSTVEARRSLPRNGTRRLKGVTQKKKVPLTAQIEPSSHRCSGERSRAGSIYAFPLILNLAIHFFR